MKLLPVLLLTTGCAFEALPESTDCSATEGLTFESYLAVGDATYTAVANGTVVTRGGRSSSLVGAGGVGVAERDGRVYLVDHAGAVSELGADMVVKGTGCRL